MLRCFSYLLRLWHAWKYVEEPEDRIHASRRVWLSLEPPDDELAKLKELALRTKAKIKRFRRDRCESFARDREASLRHVEARIHSIEGELRRAA